MHAGVTGLSGGMFVAVLVAAVTHATWNAIAHGIKDTGAGGRWVSFTLIGIGGATASALLLPFTAAPAARSLPYLAASAVVHVAYNLLLMTSFRLGDFGQVYPLARGTSPLVVTVLAAAFIGEVPSAVQWLGVVAVSVGLASLVFAGGRVTRRDLPAVAVAFGTGLTIAGYTTIDGLGVRASGSPAGYTGWLILLESLPIPLYVAACRRSLFREIGRREWLPGTLGGVLSIAAYGLILWAQTRSALAPVAALRETSIIFGALIATFFFHERFGRVRILAAACVVAGILLLDLG